MAKLLSAVVLVILTTAVALAGEKESAAESAAGAWLSDIDAGEYVTSWSNAGAPFKKQLTPLAWENAASAASPCR
jgi:predicted transcriptional regulator